MVLGNLDMAVALDMYSQDGAQPLQRRTAERLEQATPTGADVPCHCARPAAHRISAFRSIGETSPRHDPARNKVD